MANPNPNSNPPITIASAIYKLQLHLFNTPSTPFDLLIAASTLLSKPDYDDIVTERTISDLFSVRPPAEGAFKGSLGDERRADVDVRREKVEDVLRLFGCFDGDEDEEEVRRGERLGKLKLEIKEKERAVDGDLKLGEWIGPPNAIEGYIPHLDRGSNIPSKSETAQETGSASSTEVDHMTPSLRDECDGDPSKRSSAMINDVPETTAKKLEDMIITEKKNTSKQSLESLKLKFQTNVAAHNIGKVDNGDMGFTSSIIVGNDFDAALSKSCVVSTQDASELIAKQLEEVVLAEKKKKKVKKSKSSSSNARKIASGRKNDKIDFQSTIITGDLVNVTSGTSSTSSLDSSSKDSVNVHVKNKTEPLGYGESDDVMLSGGVSMEKKHVSQENELKSSLKTSRSKGGNRSVKWADEVILEVLEDKKDTPQVMREEDLDSSLRLASAEACAAALSHAASAAASGDVDAGDAVSEAGIVILPQPQYCEDRESEADEEACEFDQGVLKWPTKTVLLDTDVFEVEDSWHDTPPEGFSLTLSPFATMWMALFGWITCSSLCYIYGHDEISHEDFLFVNGREYPRKTFLRDGKSSEIRLALDGFICRALPGLVMDLKLPTPVSTLEKFLARLLDTMSFVDALPSFRMKQWQVIVLLFIEALSVHRLPSLAPQMTSRNLLLHTVLNAARVSIEEYETMRDLMMPLGRLPQFSMQSGG
ncbi:uncharacterized protein A4U43_C07F11500 [Asparagus officinalis]|uniref:Uncharacterized protein n=1 Tax=Asparagus officinalis TaxID=4686 RepID=A0A5P1EB67_ASPOF|nr:uncharacterized protein A4U43_C07F11500 [Asparagus officinalis]